MTSTPAPKRRIDWTGNYVVSCDGCPVATIALSRAWTDGGPRFTAAIDDGTTVLSGGAGHALHEALAKIAPGEQVRPHFPGCDPRGWRIRAEGTAPWAMQPTEEVVNG